MTLLELHGIGMVYGAIRALAEVDYTVAPGEIVGLIGDNGAGKSTLVKIIAGNFPPTLSGAPDTWAFTTQPVTSDTMSNRLSDPDQLPDKMSNGQSGGTTFAVPGGHMMLQFSAPPSSGTSNSPFVTSPNSALVPSEHR